MEIKMELMEARIREMQREYERRLTDMERKYEELETRLLKTTATHEEKIQELTPASVKCTILEKEEESSECKMTKIEKTPDIPKKIVPADWLKKEELRSILFPTRKKRVIIIRPKWEDVMRQPTRLMFQFKGKSYLCRTEHGHTFKDSQTDESFTTLNRWVESIIFKVTGKNTTKKNVYDELDYYHEKAHIWKNLGLDFVGNDIDFNPL